MHKYLTEYLAKEVGFSDDEAKDIANADQGTDEDRNTEPFASVEAREKFHFTTQQRRDEMRASAIATNDPKLIGQYLHAYQDSFSHQSEGVPETYARRFLDLFSSQPKISPYTKSHL